MTDRETEVAEALEAQGWNITNNGWPDFLCWRDAPDGTREIMGVEVKRDDADALKENQAENHAVLISAGIPVFVARTVPALLQEPHVRVPDLLLEASRVVLRGGEVGSVLPETREEIDG